MSTATMLTLIVIVLSGCSGEKVVKKNKDVYRANLPYELPSGATNVVFLGNKWYTFELNGDKFMGRSHYHRQCITQVK